MRFYDREEQLETLREMRELSYNGYSRLTVVTGRRRIGKTTLIKEAYRDEPYVYLFVGKKKESAGNTHSYLMNSRISWRSIHPYTVIFRIGGTSTRKRVM